MNVKVLSVNVDANATIAMSIKYLDSMLQQTKLAEAVKQQGKCLDRLYKSRPTRQCFEKVRFPLTL